MSISVAAFVCGCLLLLSRCEAAAIECPPTGFDTVENFNLTQYIAAPWYIQQQMENTYQLKEDLYCVRAKYVPEDPEDYSKGIVVQNYRNRGGVNENPGGSSGAGGSPCFGFDQLKAFPAYTGLAGPTDASKVLVGPAPLAAMGMSNLGDYWVVAVGASANKTIGYDWAIVSAGAPNVTTPKGCRTGTQAMQFGGAVNGVGLWLFSRKQVDPAGVKIMRTKAQELGFDLDVLSNVTQADCTYIKADPVCDDEPVECQGESRDFGSVNMTGGAAMNMTGGMPTNMTVRCFNGSENLPLAWGNSTAPPGPANRSANATSSGRIAAGMNWALQLTVVLVVCWVTSFVGLIDEKL